MNSENIKNKNCSDNNLKSESEIMNNSLNNN